MQKNWTHMIFLFLLLGCGNLANKNEVVQSALGHQEMELLNDEFNKAIAAKDLDRVLKLYSRKMLWLPPNEKRSSGQEAVSNNYSFITENEQVHLSHRLDTAFISDTNDLAVLIGTYYFKMDGDNIVADTGKFSLTLIKEDSKWKICSDIFNSDLSK